MKTVERYIGLLEKNYIIFRLPPYTKNKRREITKLKKIYFYDLGIRNAIINNFNFSADRTDMGGLWENFVIVERLKYRAYHGISALQYFWRTYDGSEIDLIEEQGADVKLYECKWSTSNKKKECFTRLQDGFAGSIKCYYERFIEGFFVLSPLVSSGGRYMTYGHVAFFSIL